MMELAREA